MAYLAQESITGTRLHTTCAEVRISIDNEGQPKTQIVLDLVDPGIDLATLARIVAPGNRLALVNERPVSTIVD